MGRSLIGLVIVVILGYMAMLIVIYLKQDSMIYFPEKEIWTTPKAIGLPYEDISRKTKDGIDIAGWYVESAGEQATLLFCHGNAGNIADRLDSINIFNDLHLTVLIFDYRRLWQKRRKAV